MRQGDEAEFRVLGVDELERLPDARALDDFWLDCVVDAERLQRLDRRGPVRGGVGIGDRQFCELAGFEGGLAVGHVDDPAKQHELADRVGEDGSRHAEALVDRGLGPILIGGQKHLVGRVVLDLGQEAARGAEAQHRLVSGLLLEQRGDLFRRLGEIRGDRDVGLRGFGGTGKRHKKRPERSRQPFQSHCALPPVSISSEALPLVSPKAYGRQDGPIYFSILFAGPMCNRPNRGIR